MKLTESFLKQVKESQKNLINISNNSGIEFSKSNTSLDYIHKKSMYKARYDFSNAKLGDILYYNSKYRYNLVSGKPVGECCIIAGQIDDYPRFWSIKDEYNSTMCSNSDNWQTLMDTDFTDIIPSDYPNSRKDDIYGYDNTKILNDLYFNTKNFNNVYGDDYYFPAVGELYMAKQNNDKLQYKLKEDFYWTSTGNTTVTSYDGYKVTPYIYAVYGDGVPSTMEDEVEQIDPLDNLCVRLFIHIPDNNEKDINESKLLKFDNNTQFNKSNNVNNHIEKTVKKCILENCKVGDIVYQVEPYRYKISSIEIPEMANQEIGICCISGTDEIGPKFIYKEQTPLLPLYEKTVLGRPIIGKSIKYPNGYDLTQEMLNYEHATGAKEVAITLSEKVKADLYIPSAIELKIGTNNILQELNDGYFYKNNSIYDKYLANISVRSSNTIWTSSEPSTSKDLNNIAMDQIGRTFFHDHYWTAHNINPFIYIDEHNIVYSDVNESSLLQFDNDINFEKNNSLSMASKKAIDKIYDFGNCNYGDILYYDETIGYNLVSGIEKAICCITKGQLDDYPRFMFIHDVEDGPSYGNIHFLPNEDEYNMSIAKEKNEFLNILDSVYSPNNYDCKCGYNITRILNNTIQIQAVVETINAGAIEDQKYLYIPTSDELAYACSNGAAKLLDNNNGKYLTCSCIIQEITEETSEGYITDLYGTNETIWVTDSLIGKKPDDILDSDSIENDIENPNPCKCRPFFYIKGLIEERKNK